MSVYNKKDIIRFNQEIGESGELRNDSSLDFALNLIKHKKSWIYELSYIIRSLIIDHPFVDGNKRTAYMVASLYFEDNNRDFNETKLIDVIFKIAKKNITDINRIMRLLLKP